MPKYIIEIEDNAEGIRFRAGVVEATEVSAGEDSPAKRMCDYLVMGAQLWVETQSMDLEQTKAHLDARTANQPGQGAVMTKQANEQTAQDALLQVAMVKIVIMDALDKAGGELDALTLFSRVVELMGDTHDPLSMVAALELEPTDIIRATPDGLLKLKQAQQSLGGQ
jgi:hypothetical protein